MPQFQTIATIDAPAPQGLSQSRVRQRLFNLAITELSAKFPVVRADPEPGETPLGLRMSLARAATRTGRAVDTWHDSEAAYARLRDA